MSEMFTTLRRPNMGPRIHKCLVDYGHPSLFGEPPPRFRKVPLFSIDAALAESSHASNPCQRLCGSQSWSRPERRTVKPAWFTRVHRGNTCSTFQPLGLRVAADLFILAIDIKSLRRLCPDTRTDTPSQALRGLRRLIAPNHTAIEEKRGFKINSPILCPLRSIVNLRDPTLNHIAIAFRPAPNRTQSQVQAFASKVCVLLTGHIY